MIIRRRRTRNFTILENEVVEDERLALDEIGLLAWLRSRPDSWEISRAAIGRRFKIGRDKVARIFKSLIECGWMVREPTLPGESARYIVLDEPGAEVEMSGEELAEIGEAATPVASSSQSDNPATGDPLPENPLPENPATLVRTDSKQIPTPKPPSVPEATLAVIVPGRPAQAEAPQAGIQGDQAADPEFEADWSQLVATWPCGIVDVPKARAELAKLSVTDRKAMLAKVPDYDARCRRYDDKPKAAHLAIRKRFWEGLSKVAAPSALHFVPAKDPGGAAVRVLAALLGNVSVPQHWCGRGPDGVTFGYWLWFELNPRFNALALAHPPRIPMPNRHHWPEFRAHSQHHGAWQSFVDATMGEQRKKHLPLERGHIRAPWPWPPLVDGRLSDSESPSSTGPPLPELSERDEADFVGS